MFMYAIIVLPSVSVLIGADTLRLPQPSKLQASAVNVYSVYGMIPLFTLNTGCTVV